MTDPRDEALRMALDVLKSAGLFLHHWRSVDEAIAAIRAALEQKPEPDCEPAAWLHISERDGLTPPSISFALRRDQAQPMINRGVPMRPLYYATPPQRTPLTKDEIERIYTQWDAMPHASIGALVRLVEIAHGITWDQDA